MKPEEYLKQPYARILIPDDSGFFSAEILEFPGCFSQGKNAQEAFQNLEKAALAWIEAALEQGQEIPAPSANHGYPGRIALRLPRSIHRKAAQFAERDGTSLNQFLVSAIAVRVGAEELQFRILDRLEERKDSFQVLPGNLQIQVTTHSGVAQSGFCSSGTGSFMGWGISKALVPSAENVDYWKMRSAHREEENVADR